MKIKVAIQNSEPFLILRYEADEWETLKKKLESFGLEKAHTVRGFGSNSFWFYRDRNANLFQYLKKIYSISIQDDINASLIGGYPQFNVALFRVIPDEQGEVKIKLNNFLSILEVSRLVSWIATGIKALLEIANGVEFDLTLKKKVIE